MSSFEDKAGMRKRKYSAGSAASFVGGTDTGEKWPQRVHFTDLTLKR